MSETHTNMHAQAQHPTDEQLFDLVNGSLRRGLRRRVERHLASCTQCAGLAAAARATAPRLGRAGETLPAHHAARLHEALDAEWGRRIEGQRRARRPLPNWRRRLNVGLALGGVAAVLGFVAVPGLLSSSGNASRVSEQPSSSAGESADVSGTSAMQATGGDLPPQTDAVGDPLASSGAAADTAASTVAPGFANERSLDARNSAKERREPDGLGELPDEDGNPMPENLTGESLIQSKARDDETGSMAIPTDPFGNAANVCLLQFAGSSVAITGDLIAVGQQLTLGPIGAIAFVCIPNPEPVSITAPGQPAK